ncbi:MAG: hypothetical protein AB7L13_02005 [Acidimicrobiia bacterium]
MIKPLVAVALPLAFIAGPFMAAVVTTLCVAIMAVNRVIAAAG